MILQNMNTQQDKSKRIRTHPQNRALHKFCTETAVELNNHGISLVAVVSKVHVDWTMDAVKSIFKAISKAKYGKEHTSDLTTYELQEVYLEVTRLLSEFGIYMQWPSIENTDEAMNSYSQFK